MVEGNMAAGKNAWFIVVAIVLMTIALIVSDLIPITAMELPPWYPPVIL